MTEPEKRAYFKYVGPHAEGLALVDFLVKRFTYFDAEHWTHLIQKGDVLLNEGPTEPGYVLRNGDKVSYLALMRSEPVAPKKIPILYEDEDLVIVNKPVHLPVHPTGRYLRNTLINILKEQRKTEKLFLAHRLDRETSGVCVLTKTTLAKDKIYWQFFKNETDKTYWGLVWGAPQPGSGVIDAPMGPASPAQSQIRIKQVVNAPESKTAKTKYHTLSTKWIEAPEWDPPQWPSMEKLMKGREFRSPWPISLVEAKPITGRTNQIRVHLAHIGAGIVGDKLYDPDEKIFLAFKDQNKSMETKKGSFVQLSPELRKHLILDAHGLHARKLGLRHPRTGKWLEVTAPAPSTWQGLYTPPKHS
jgi:23S rRNA pseudouridine1911/1915/1917 synthase